jgi:general stress protein 26
MSANKDRALKLIDEMLHIVDEADKNVQSCSTSTTKTTTQSSPTKADNFDWKYLTDVKDSYSGKTFRVTKDLSLLQKEWKDSQLGPNDDLKPYLGTVGLCIQVEEDDNTLQLRWENMDTVWMPAKACAPAPDLKPSIPGFECDWLPPEGLEQWRDDEKHKEEEKTGGGVSGIVHSVVEKAHEVASNVKDTVSHILHPSGSGKEELLSSVEDEYVKTGAHVQITHNMKILQHAWEEATLGQHEDLKPYLGCVGKIMQIEEDDDTVQLRWENLDTAWFPIKACMAAPNKPLSIPSLQADWLTPDELKGKEDKEEPSLLPEQKNETEEYYKKMQQQSEQS